MASRPAHHGALATANATISSTITATRLARVARRTSKPAAGRFNCMVMSKPLCGFGQQALRPRHQNAEEHHVAEPDAPARIEVKAHLLRDTQRHAADECAPERAHAADDH